jgi:hypothetical protein
MRRQPMTRLATTSGFFRALRSAASGRASRAGRACYLIQTGEFEAAAAVGAWVSHHPGVTAAVAAGLTERERDEMRASLEVRGIGGNSE